MRKASAASILCLLVVALAGCGALQKMRHYQIRKRYTSNAFPANPIPGLKTVGVLVLDASYNYKVDTLELLRALHAKLQEIDGLEVAPDASLLQAAQRLTAKLKDKFALPRDSMSLADELKIDGLFVAIVTEYDPYGEPLISMGLTLFSRAMTPLKPIDIDAVIQGGRPLPMPDTPSAKPVTAVFAVYDASQQKVRQRLRWFAEGHTAEDVGLAWERYYRTMPRYMSFVSYEIVWKLFERIDEDISKASAAQAAGAGGLRPGSATPAR